MTIGTSIFGGNLDFHARLSFMEIMLVHVAGFILFTIYKIQRTMFYAELRLRRNVHWTDWLTYPLAAMVSQDSLYWFRDMPRNSSGSVLVGILTLSNLLVYLAYISNFQVTCVYED